MKTIFILFSGFIIILSTFSIAVSAGPSDANFRSAYKLILSQADKDRDGKLSLSECKASWKDKAIADKNCNSWNVNGDNFITEDEYVQQGWNIMRKRK